MKVLIACEESQAVCKEFRRLGHEAYSCDIQECSGGHPEWHIIANALTAIYAHNKPGALFTQEMKPLIIDKWDLLIAHPPCTYLSAAGACRMYPTAGNIDVQRLHKAMFAKEFFMKILNSGIERICVENPKPLTIVQLPAHQQVIQPFQFGHNYSKRTHLWLKNLPPLLPTSVPTEAVVRYVSGGSKNAKGEKRKTEAMKHRDRKTNSKTFPGIAAAMAEQWGGEIFNKATGT